MDDSLDGLVMVNPGIRKLAGHRVVVRTDIEKVKEAGKVTVVCGGGSGHEPGHAGTTSPSLIFNLLTSQSSSMEYQLKGRC